MLLFFASTDFLDTGRVDASMPSETQHLELFAVVAGNAHLSTLLGGEEDDACTWGGVTCDSQQSITSIVWWSFMLRQETSISADFRALPRKLLKIELRYLNFHGTIDLRDLPLNLDELVIIQTHTTGTLNCSALPRSLERIQIEDNKVIGLIGLCNFPETLNYFCVNEKGLKGQVLHVGKLPKEVAYILLKNSSPGEITCAVPSDFDRIEYAGKGECSFKRTL